MPIQIIVKTTINAPIDKIWKYWTEPEHITKWNNASPDWHTPLAENDVHVGGKFKSRMESKDGSQGFDFEGTYTAVDEGKRIEYEMTDGRKVKIEFTKESDGYKVTETFDGEGINSIEMQEAGSQAILNNFKAYVESK